MRVQPQRQSMMCGWRRRSCCPRVFSFFLNLTCSLSFDSNSRISNQVAMILNANFEILANFWSASEIRCHFEVFSLKNGNVFARFSVQKSQNQPKIKASRKMLEIVEYLKKCTKNSKRKHAPEENESALSKTLRLFGALFFHSLSNETSPNSLNLKMAKGHWVFWKKLQVWVYEWKKWNLKNLSD